MDDIICDHGKYVYEEAMCRHACPEDICPGFTDEYVARYGKPRLYFTAEGKIRLVFDGTP